MKSDQLITIVLAMAGWSIAYWSLLRRDRIAKKREMRTQYLIEAYRRLESAGNRHTQSPDDSRKLESAIADIQLFGSTEQVELSRDFAVAFSTKRSASLDQLLELLRRDLRRELDLGEISDRITYLRIIDE
ncbi:MAG: hypothetical protein ABL995_09765 [Bryobacteraceae bacterium]